MIWKGYTLGDDGFILKPHIFPLYKSVNTSIIMAENVVAEDKQRVCLHS
jgi:hypothetical protein